MEDGLTIGVGTSGLAMLTGINMKTKDEAALALYYGMARISKIEHFAGWRSGNEYSLWDRIAEFPELARLSKNCGGWIVWIDEDSEDLRNAVTMIDDGIEYMCANGDDAGPAWIDVDDWRAHLTKCQCI